MEITAVLGIIIAAGSLVMAFVLEGGSITALLAPTAAMIVFGGTIGATIISFSLDEIKTVPKLFKVILFKKNKDEAEIIDLITSLAEKARREGLLFLENQINEIDDPFLRQGIQLIVDGTDPEVTQNILETEIYNVEERHHVGISIFEAAGGYAPTMGIIGTVMGLVHVLSNLSSPDKLGPSIAMAFIATLYGVSSANILWLPIAAKLKNLSQREILQRELMLQGLLSLQAGHNPMLIREKLTVFLNPKKRHGNQSGKEDAYEEAS